MAGQMIRVSGAKELAREARKAGKDTQKALRQAHKETAQVVADEGKRIAPKRSGKLAKSIRGQGTQKLARVVAGRGNIPYAGPIHFGWPSRPNRAKRWRGGPIKPNPFIYDALDDRWDKVINTYEKYLEKVSQHLNTGR